MWIQNTAGVFCCIAALWMTACGIIETGYFKNRVDEATQDIVERRYGPPHRLEQRPEGGSVWTYFDRGSATASYAGTARSTYCRAYVLTFDEQEVLREWRQEDCRG